MISSRKHCSSQAFNTSRLVKMIQHDAPPVGMEILKKKIKPRKVTDYAFWVSSARGHWTNKNMKVVGALILPRIGWYAVNFITGNVLVVSQISLRIRQYSNSLPGGRNYFENKISCPIIWHKEPEPQLVTLILLTGVWSLSSWVGRSTLKIQRLPQ